MGLIHYVIKAAGSPPDLRISPDPFFRKIMVFSAAAMPPCLSNQTARRERESSRSLGWQMILIVSLRFLLWYITSGKRTEICAPFHLSTAEQGMCSQETAFQTKTATFERNRLSGCQEQKSIRNQLWFYCIFSITCTSEIEHRQGLWIFFTERFPEIQKSGSYITRT